MALTTWLLLLAVCANGILVGASLDQSIKQLPARHRIGVVAFSKFSQAADLWHGKVWYPVIGVGAAAITIVAVAVALFGSHRPHATIALAASAVLTVAHSLATGRAAPINNSQRRAGESAAQLELVFNRFERWQSVRATIQVMTLLTVAFALAAHVGGV